MGQDTRKPESKDSPKPAEVPKPSDMLKPSDTPDAAKDAAAKLLSQEGWAPRKAGENANPKPGAGPALGQPGDYASRIEKGKPFSNQTDQNDVSQRERLDKWLGLNNKDGAAVGQLRRFAGFAEQINIMIKNNNSANPTEIAEIDRDRLNRTLDVVEKYQTNQDALKEALKKNDKPELERLLKEQESLKKQMETKEFRQDLENASHDLNRGYNALRQNLGTAYDGLLTTLVEFGRKVPLEQLPQDLPTGLKGFAISNEQFRSLVSQGQLKLPERTLPDNELPTGADMREINKLLRFTDAATQEIRRGALEQQYALAQSRLNQIEPTGELAKKWFPEKVETLSDQQIEKRLAAATPWIQKGLEVQRYAELHHRFHKMVNEQFNWPSWMGGIPSNWDASAITNNPDVVKVAKDEKTQKVNIAIMMPESLDRNDANMDRIRLMDEWLAKYKGPVDQALGQIDGAKAENAVVYWGDIKAEMRVDKDGNIVEKGWKDAQGKQVFQESDGRKFRFNDAGAKEWVPLAEKLTEADFRVVNSKTDWLKPGEEIKDINLMEFRTQAKAVKGPNGEDLIEIKQVQNLQYAHWASYNGWGWVSDVKSMGADIKAEKLANDMSIPEDKGVAGGRRDGKKGDYIVTLADGRQQVIDAKSFDKLYRSKDGKPGEYEEKPRVYKPDDWLLVFRTDSGTPQPTLMQAKDVPGFVSSQAAWHWGTKIVSTGVDVLMVVSGVAEVRAAMIGAEAAAKVGVAGVEAAAGTAAKMTTMEVLGKAMLTRQGMTGALHAGFGATGFMGQGIENLGSFGKGFMQVRAIAMMLDLGYTAVGRPYSGKPFVPSAAQIAQQGFFSRGLLKFSQVMGAEAIPGRVQALGADLFFLSEIGFRQIPGIANRASGRDSQQVQQRAALERRWPQSTLLEDKKAPSSFDKQTMMRVEAFKKPTEDAMKLPEGDPKRIQFNKKLIETLQNEKADTRDRFGAAFALVTLNSKDGKLPEKIVAETASISRADLQKFVDGQRYLQAKEVLDGYTQSLKIHVSADVQAKLAQLDERAKQSTSDNAGERTAAMADLIAAFKSTTASPEEKLLAASAILFARRSGADGQLSATVAAAGQQVLAKDLVDFLYKNAQARQGSGSSATDNPGHMRLFAGDMLLRLDLDRFSLEDMNQICLSIVNDKSTPTDAAAKERMAQLKMQAMTDAHGYRLGDLYEIMKSHVEPTIAAMPTNGPKELEAKGQALASLLGRDSEAIRKTLETLRKNEDPRIAGLASYMIFATDSARASDRIENLAQLNKVGTPFAWPQSFDKEAQNRWVQAADTALVAKLKADLPGQIGSEFDRASDDKLRAAQTLMTKYADLKANPEIQAEINRGLLSVISGDNPAIAAKALPLLLSRLKAYEDIFKQTNPAELTPSMKSLRDNLFGAGAILGTLHYSVIDMLKDSSLCATYTTRAENLAKDLQKLNADYTSTKDKLSESERTDMEERIAELSRSRDTASGAIAELKKSLLQGLPSLLNLLSGSPQAAGKAIDMRSVLASVQDLCQVQSARPETASPELRTQAVSTLAELGDSSPQASSLLARVLALDPSPQVRLAALESLKKLSPDDLQRICLAQLSTERHPEVAKRLREIEFTRRRPDPDSSEYREKFDKAKVDLINQAAHSLSGAEAYLKANGDLKFLDGQTLRLQALADLKDKYFDGLGGFFNFAWNGEKGVDSYHAQMLEKYAGSMRSSMDSLGQKAATDNEALKALVYIALSNGRPLLKDDRNWGTEKATEKLKEVCRNCSPERAKEIAWAVEMLLLHQPAMNAAGRQNVLDGLKSLIAKPGQAGMSNGQIATLLATAMQRELRNTPAPGAADFKAREKLQLDMLNLLSEPRFCTKEILPILEAIADGTPKFKITRDSNGDVSKVQYPNGSSREILKHNGVPNKFIYRVAPGHETVWLADPAKPNTWYKESDKEKKEPWTGTLSFDKTSGDYVSSVPSGTIKLIIKPNGAQVEMVSDKVAKITYPDGSRREFDPPGANYKRYTFISSDKKVNDVWERDGNSNTFYKQGDTEKRKPWTGEEMVDNASADYVNVQGNTRTISRVDGSITQIKDGVIRELATPSAFAYNSSIESVRLKAKELFALMSDRSDLLRQRAQISQGVDAAMIGQKIAAALGNPDASSETVGNAIALSEKLGPIKDDNDPLRVPLEIAARDGHELVRMMAARELAKSSNADDRKLAYSVLSRLEKQGSRSGYVSEAHELITHILADANVSAADKATLVSLQKDAEKLDAASYRSKGDRIADTSADLDYQDVFERASRELKENSLRLHNLAKYEGADNWFSKNDNYKLLDADKLREAQGQASKDAYPGMIPWLWTSQKTIEKRCHDAVKEVWNKQDGQMAALGEQAKLGDNGKEAREALASIILTQGQPFRESDRAGAMHEAARAIRDCIKDGHPGSRDMMWAVQAALIEEPSLDPTTRWYLMSALDNAQKRGIIDSKEASIVMAAALESEYQGMPSRSKDPAGYRSSLTNQSFAISMLSIWGNVEASPVLKALGTYHPDMETRRRAKETLEYLNWKSRHPRVDAGRANLENQRADAGIADKIGNQRANATASGDKPVRAAAVAASDENRQLALNQLQDQILEFERVRLRLPQGSSPEQVIRALQAEDNRSA